MHFLTAVNLRITSVHSIIAGEFTDLRGPRIGIFAAFGLIAILILGVAEIAYLVSRALRSEGRGRRSWAAIAIGLAVILLAAVPLITSVNIDEPSVQCGRPLLARAELDTIALDPIAQDKAVACRQRLDARRNLALGLVASGSFIVVATAIISFVSVRTDRRREVGTAPHNPD